ncbi:MAG: PIN/TRAM domain-containing protein [Eubacterium sp.]|jgi:uncharacterized protein YacL
MLNKLLRLIFTALGGLLGYGIFLLIGTAMENTGKSMSDVFTVQKQILIAAVLVSVFALIFYKFSPSILKHTSKVAEDITKDLNNVSTGTIISGLVGLILGLIIARLITSIFLPITHGYVSLIISVVLYIVLGYFGTVILASKGKDLFNSIGTIGARKSDRTDMPQKEQEDTVDQAQNAKYQYQGNKRRRQPASPKILDTSVIIDGRIAEIMNTGFIEGPIIIPEFVLIELRHIADSADSLKRVRGRRGLDILNRIQSDFGIEIYNTENEKTLKDIPEVDVKLLKLAKIMNGKVVTNDYNLNKVASINGVEVLNINELANTLKPVVIPGEKMTVTPVKQGKDSSQAVAYLDDGTMVVVEDGRGSIGKTVSITVTNALQTAAGRMIFGRIRP